MTENPSHCRSLAELEDRWTTLGRVSNELDISRSYLFRAPWHCGSGLPGPGDPRTGFHIIVRHRRLLRHAGPSSLVKSHTKPKSSGRFFELRLLLVPGHLHTAELLRGPLFSSRVLVSGPGLFRLNRWPNQAPTGPHKGSHNPAIRPTSQPAIQ